MKKYYCIESMKIYDEEFHEVGGFKYTNEVAGLTRITQSETSAKLHFCTEKDASGWYILTEIIQTGVMTKAAEKVYRETGGK